MSLELAKIKRGFQNAQTRKRNFESMYRECYRFAMPGREYELNHTEGQEPDPDIYDDTAIDSTLNFANRIAAAMVPVDYRWVDFQSGSDIPEEFKYNVNVMLDAFTKRYFDLINTTNFHEEFADAAKDLAVGCAGIVINDLNDDVPIVHHSVPAPRLYLAGGKDGDFAQVYWDEMFDVHDIESLWPGAKLDDEMKRKLEDRVGPATDTMIHVNQAVIRNSEGQYEYWVMNKNFTHEIYHDTQESSPIIVDVFDRYAGETYGRGPLTTALPTIRTANRLTELILANASIAVSGVYTAVDDGVLNPDMVEIEEGAIIPVNSNGGSYGPSLAPLQRSGDFNIGDILLKDLQQSIRRKLYDDTAAPLDRTVRSAEEVRFRREQLARDIGPSYGMLIRFVTKIIKRHVYLLNRRGLLPPVKIDNRQVKLNFVGPLAQAQQMEDLNSIDSAAFRMNNIIPGLASAYFKPDVLAPYINERSGVPANLGRSPEEMAQAMQAAQQGGRETVDEISNANQNRQTTTEPQ